MYPQILDPAQSSRVDGNAVAPIHRGGWRTDASLGGLFATGMRHGVYPSRHGETYEYVST